MLSLLKIALIANRVFFKTLPRSVKTSFMTKGHGQGVLKCKITDPKYLWPEPQTPGEWLIIHHTFKLPLLWNPWAIWYQISCVASWDWGNGKLFKWYGPMTNMSAGPIYGKNLKKSSFSELIYRWPWNLVCSIVYASTTKIIQIMTLGWPWPILCQGQIWSLRFLSWAKVKFIYFFETIAAVLIDDW